MSNSTTQAVDGKLMYKISEVCELVSMSRSVIYEEIKAGRLVITKRGRATLVAADDLADYVALLKRETREAAA